MSAFIYGFILLAAEAGHAEGGFIEFYNKYLNYPGFEVWKFINLAIFVAIAVYFGKKKLGPKFIARREAIRAELIKAEEEKQAALAQLTSTEAKLAALDAEKTAILQKAEEEAKAEQARLAAQTESDVKKMLEQSTGEISRLSQQTRAELRRFSAEESIRLAEERLRSQIDAEKDARLIKSGIRAIGGLN